MESKSSVFEYVNVIITLGLMLFFRFIPAPAPMTPYGMAVIGVFLGMIYGWMTSQRGLIWPSLAGLVAFGLTDFGDVSVVMANLFSSNTAALLVVSFLLIGPMMESNCGEYLITKLLTSKFCQGKPWNFTFAMVVGLGILSYIINPFIIAIFMLTIFADLFAKAGYKRGDKYPTMMIIGMFIGFLIMMGIFPWHGWGLYGVGAFAQASGGYMIDYGKYCIVSVVFYLATMTGYVVLMRIMGCNVEPLRNMDLSNLKEQYMKNGLSKYQKAILCVYIGVAIGAVLITFFGGTTGVRWLLKRISVYGATLVGLAVALFVKVEGRPLFDIKVCAKYVQWDMIFCICAALCVSSALTNADTGVSAFIAKSVAPLLAGKSQTMFMIILTLLVLGATNLSNNNAVLFTFMAIAGSFYANGIITNPAAAVFIITFASALGFYTPASSGFGAMIHSSQSVTPGSVYKYGAVVMIYLVIMFTIVVVPLCNLLF